MSKKIIFIQGEPGTGKSIHAEELQRNLGGIVVHTAEQLARMMASPDFFGPIIVDIYGSFEVEVVKCEVRPAAIDFYANNHKVTMPGNPRPFDA